jgi:hypothetical protein
MRAALIIGPPCNQSIFRWKILNTKYFNGRLISNSAHQVGKRILIRGCMRHSWQPPIAKGSSQTNSSGFRPGQTYCSRGSCQFVCILHTNLISLFVISTHSNKGYVGLTGWPSLEASLETDHVAA